MFNGRLFEAYIVSLYSNVLSLVFVTKSIVERELTSGIFKSLGAMGLEESPGQDSLSLYLFVTCKGPTRVYKYIYISINCTTYIKYINYTEYTK